MLSEIKRIAQNNGYKLLDHQENIKMISFTKEEIRINVYYTKMTVATCINHPKKTKRSCFAGAYGM